MGRHSRARHSEAPPRHWSHLLAGLPWITIVLVLILLVGTIDVLRPNRYTGESTLTAADEATADRVSMLLADPDLVDRVEGDIELGSAYEGTVSLTVHHAAEDTEVHVAATTPDPRLSAVAADAAAGLLIEDVPEGQLSLSGPAQVPTDPDGERDLRWVWLALVALAGAVWMEGAHRIWLRDHRVVPEPAR